MIKHLTIIALISSFSMPAFANEDQAFLSNARKNFQNLPDGYMCLGQMEKLYHLYGRKDDSIKVVDAIKQDYSDKKIIAEKLIQDTYKSNKAFRNAVQGYSKAATDFSKVVQPLLDQEEAILKSVDGVKDQALLNKADDAIWELGIGDLEVDFVYEMESKKYLQNIAKEIKIQSESNSDRPKLESAWVSDAGYLDSMILIMQMRYPDGTYHNVETTISLPASENLALKTDITYDLAPSSIGDGIIKEKSGFDNEFLAKSQGKSENAKWSTKFSAKTSFDFNATQLFRALGMKAVASNSYYGPYDFPKNAVESILGNYSLSLKQANSFEQFYRDSHEILNEFDSNELSQCLTQVDMDLSSIQASNRGIEVEYKVDHQFPQVEKPVKRGVAASKTAQ
jgi:hypothetical protein